MTSFSSIPKPKKASNLISIKKSDLSVLDVEEKKKVAKRKVVFCQQSAAEHLSTEKTKTVKAKSTASSAVLSKCTS